MNTNNLSFRLKTVAKFVPGNAHVADIGSDHAYLPCFLVKNKGIQFAIAGEVAEGPYQSAKRNVLAEGLSKQISVRIGDGLEVLDNGEADCITIAGMGGTLISNILERGKSKLESVERLVLQPNVSAVSVRKWLLENDWELISEEIIEEDEKIYEILAAVKGDANRPYKGMPLKQGLLLGPFLIQNQNPVFKKKWEMERKNWERIYAQLNHAAPSVDTDRKKMEIVEKMKLVEEAVK